MNKLAEIQREVDYLTRIDELLGDDLHCRLIGNLDKRDPEDHEESVMKEKSDLLIRFAQMIKQYDTDDWTPLIKARFAKGLDDLELFFQQEEATK